MRRKANPRQNFWHIPKSVVFPGGFVITMTQLTNAEMFAKHGEYYDGFFDPKTRHIDLARKAPWQRKWWVYAQLVRQIIAELWVPSLVEQGLAVERIPPRKSSRRTPPPLPPVDANGRGM